MVWDGEFAGMRLKLESLPVTPFLLLSDSEVAIAAVRYGALCSQVRTADIGKIG